MYIYLFLPQVKRYMIITYKHGIYELPHEMLKILKKSENIRKVCKLHGMVA